MDASEKLVTIAENEQKVYDAGYEAGKQAGGGNTDEAFENGKKEIWKGITNHGTRVNYANGFQYTDLDCFYPYTDLQPTNAGYMFAQTRNNGTIDFVERFEQFGTTLDFSKATTMARTFYVSGATRLGVIDCRSATSLEYFVCSSIYLHTIEKMIVHSGNTYKSSFDGCSALEEIRFSNDSVIGNNIDFSDCTMLSHDSLFSNTEYEDGIKIGIINALEQKTSGTFTCKIGEKNIAKLTEPEKAIATQKGWTLL